MEKQPVFTFGAIADIQYGDLDDYFAQYSGRVRFYRHSLAHTSQAVEEFEQLSALHILQLGDVIDGKSKKTASEALAAVLDIFKLSKISVHHTVGNHELYNFTRAEILDLLFQSDKAYYSFDQDNVKFVCLDTYDVSMLGIDRESDEYKRLGEYLRSKNPNECLNDPDGLIDVERRFVQFNGALSEAQISWLEEQLEEAVNTKRKVVVYGHANIHPQVTRYKNLIWNYPEVLERIEGCPAVVLIFSGHTHHYASVRSDTGKLYVCLPGVIETPPTGRGWAAVKVYSNRMEVVVHDNEDSHMLSVNF